MMATRRKSKRVTSPAAPATATGGTGGTGGRAYCSMREPAARAFAPGVSGERLGLLLMNSDKWVNGTLLRYAFFPNSGNFKPWAGNDALKSQVRKAIKQWTS